MTHKRNGHEQGNDRKGAGSCERPLIQKTLGRRSIGTVCHDGRPGPRRGQKGKLSKLQPGYVNASLAKTPGDTFLAPTWVNQTLGFFSFQSIFDRSFGCSYTTLAPRTSVGN
jgi:hypothetical protein